MRTRTHLTTPPGHEPELSADTRPGDETFVPGFELPQEPSVPGRLRRLWTTLAVLAVLALAGYGALRVMTSGQTFDPALDSDVAPVEDGASGTDADPTPTGLPGQ